MKITFKKEEIFLHETASGHRYSIDVYRYKPANATKIVYMQGGLHGIELSGIPLLYEWMKEVEDQQLPFQIICVPMANPMGLDSQIMGVQTGYNNIHTNPQNCHNWNRIGNLREEKSIEGNWINTLLSISERADIVLDFHTAGFEMVPHVYCHSSQIEHVIKLGIPNVLSWNEPSASFCDTCFTRNQVAITFELSPSRTVNKENLENNLEVLRRFFDMKFPSEPAKVWKVSANLKKLFSPHSGVIMWYVKPGGLLKKGDPIAVIYNREGKKKVESPYTGSILINYPSHAVYEHQEIAKFLVD